MTDLAREIVEGAVAIILIGRGVMSHFEHKKTSKQVSDINIYFNGEMEKKLEQARQEGRDEILNSKK